MSTSVAADAGGLPEDVEVTSTPREPVSDPTLGIRVPVTPSGSPPHRLVAIGDSLFQGFQSGAVYHTDLSVPAILAEELGVLERFRYPRYGGMGGLPVNIELLVRDLEERFGENVDLWEVPLALFRARQWMDEVEDYWEQGPGSLIPQLTGINNNLAMHGWDLRDALDLTAERCLARLREAKDDLVQQMVENDSERAALRVYRRPPNRPGR